jgi:DAACS family dicarboxylate/amino acid:cation (Na+ or H+) symporter
MLFMVVIPLVFSSLALGVASLGDLKRLGRDGGRTLLYFVSVTAFSFAIGLVLVNVLRPGEGLPAGTREKLLETYRGEAASRMETAGKAGFGPSLLVNIVPRNPVDAAAKGHMLGVILFALLFGIGVTKLSAEKNAFWMRLLEGLADVTVVIIGMALKIAPFGVFGLIFSVTSRFGFDILRQLLLFVVTVLLGLTIRAGVSPWVILKKVRPIMITALSTSSSAIGTAGVPGGSIPLLVLVLTSVGVPAEGIAVIIGVDRLLDMARTVPNVIGDVTCAVYVAKKEGFVLKI